jgi:hypothetical protein
MIKAVNDPPPLVENDLYGVTAGTVNRWGRS